MLKYTDLPDDEKTAAEKKTAKDRRLATDEELFEQLKAHDAPPRPDASTGTA